MVVYAAIWDSKYLNVYFSYVVFCILCERLFGRGFFQKWLFLRRSEDVLLPLSI